jgi:hypothetical protein
MRWLALLLVLLVARTAAAHCDVTTFPVNGASDVPTNTHLWIGSYLKGPYSLTTGTNPRAVTAKPFEGPLLEIDPGPLLPDRSYALMANGVQVMTFVTGHAAQTSQPPMPPVVDQLHVTDGFLNTVVRAPGAAMLRVSIHRDLSTGAALGEMWIPSQGVRAGQLSACAGVSPSVGESLCFWVSSVSNVGVASGVTGRCAVDEPAQPYAADQRPELEAPVPPRIAPSPSRWRPDLMILAGAIVLALWYIARRASHERLYFRCGEQQPIDTITVAWIARRQLIRRLIALAVIGAAAYVVLPLAALGVVVVADLWRLVAVTRDVANGWPALSDPRRGRAYVDNDGHSWISVGPFDLERAAAARLPRARATRR